MKYSLILFLFLSMFSGSVTAQALNPSSFGDERQQQIQLGLGLDFGLVTEIHYTQQRQLRSQDIFLTTSLTIPSGKILLDDWAVGAGVFYPILSLHKFRLNAEGNLLYRRLSSQQQMASNFGYQLGFSTGWYTQRWFFGAKVMIDKAQWTYITHPEAYLTQYPDAAGGWYNATGGNLTSVLQGGYSFSKLDLGICLGAPINTAGSLNNLPFIAKVFVGTYW